MTETAPTAGAPEPEARPRRLIPRYPTQLRVRVRGRTADAATLEYGARDVSRGGLFIASDDCPELFAEVDVWLPLPQGGEAQLHARVVHIVSASKAAVAGVTAGMGLEFEALTQAQNQAVMRIVSAARAEHLGRRSVRRRDQPERGTLPLDAMLGYLLDAVDGQCDPEALSERLGIPLDLTEEMLHELLRLQLIEMGAESAPSPPRAPVISAAREPIATSLAARPARSTGLPPSVRAQLEALWLQLAHLNHYEVLGVTYTCSGTDIRARFFELGKVFHPDTYYGRALGDDLRKLERVFARLSEAYAALGRETSRREYDDYLANKRPPLQAEQPRLEPSSPSQPPTPQILLRSKQQRALREPPQVTQPVPTLMAAEKAYATGDLSEAYRQLARLRGVNIADRNLGRRIAKLRGRIAKTLHLSLTRQARYEEQHQKWADAAESWLGVCEGTPDDAAAHRCAALALIAARRDPQLALRLAKRAVSLQPDDAETRRTLGRAYLAAGLKLNARHELELATRLVERAASPSMSPIAECLGHS
jgi:tetratricopeptide (TPR) repeat protein